MQHKYCTGKTDLDRQICEIANKYSDPQNAEVVRQLLTTAVKLYFDGANQADMKLINIAFKELRHALRIFTPYRNVKRVTIWGSSRISSDDREYKMALDFSKKIVKKGFMVITGGGGGVMEAGNRGAGDKGFGVNIELPMEQVPNIYVKGEKLIHFHYFFTRKLIFVKESDATVLFPGGFGTNDEAFEVLTLCQTGKAIPRPVVLAEPWGGNFWAKWIKFVKDGMVKKKFIHKEDLDLFYYAHSADEAVNYVVNFYKNYHSLRYVGPLTVIRLNKPLPPTAMNELNKKYSDILISGKIEASAPTPEEVRDKDHIDLPRLVMKFNKRDYGKLYRMVRRINEF